MSEKLVLVSCVTLTHFLPHRRRNYYLLFLGFFFSVSTVLVLTRRQGKSKEPFVSTGALCVPQSLWFPRNLFVFYTHTYFNKIKLHCVVGAVLHGISGVSVKYKLAYVKNREVSLACLFAKRFSWAVFAICFPCNTLLELF